MHKTICIKTKNKNISEYLLKELEYFELQDIYVSCYDFKYYNNTIIHYVGKNVELFLSKISTLLSYIVIDFYEPHLISNILNSNYFYFSLEDKRKIFNLCLTNVDFSNSISMFNIITNSFCEYFVDNKYVILDGFVNFKLASYIKELDLLVDICVNKFIVEREYLEFTNLLAAYIQTHLPNSNILHLIYNNEESILLDENKKIVEYTDELTTQKYVSDITFSSNDFALNSLLTLLPQKLYIHLIDKEDDFIQTLKLIFDNRVYICHDCDLCTLYRNKKNITKL